MFKLTEGLIAGTGFTLETHPAIVGLLELAGVRPGFQKHELASKKRFQYQWQDVSAAFARCVEKGATDGDLFKLYALQSHVPPFCYLDYTDISTWKLARIEAHASRTVISEALEKVAAAAQRTMKSYAIKSLADLRLARKLNGLDGLESLGSFAKVEKFALDRGIVMSWMAMGMRVFSTLIYDEFGECEVQIHSSRRADAMAVLHRMEGKA